MPPKPPSVHASRHYRIRVEVDGAAVGFFSEVSIGAATTEVVDFRDGTQPDAVARKIPGMTKFANVTLKRGITGELNLYQWHRQIVDGQPGGTQRAVSISLTDHRDQAIAKFNFRDAWPVKYEVAPLLGNGNEVAIESLELTHDGFEREI